MNAHYRHAAYPGVAWWIKRPCVVNEYDEDTGELIHEEDSDRFVVAVMVGDDREFIHDVDELTRLAETEYCHECGQIGCGHNIPEED